MKKYQQLRRIAAGMACLAVIPSSVLAGSYLEGKTHSRDPSLPEPLTPSEQHWQPPYTPGDPARAEKVEKRTQYYMEQTFGTEGVHDERHDVGAADINRLVARAQAGDPDAMGQMGYNYQYGYGVEKNEQMAVEWYKRAIEYGGDEYYSAIGDLYRDYSSGQQQGFFSGIRDMISGGGENAVQKDNAIAREWYEKGLDHNDWRAYAGLAELYRDGAGGVQKDMAIANAYYNQGMRLKKIQDEREILEMKRNIRMRAEREIPVIPSEEPEQPAQETGTDPMANLPTIILDGERCGYSPSRLTRHGYSSVYDVRCPNLRGKQLTATKASLPGLQCDIERIGGGAALLLLCNVAEAQGVSIGSATCSLRTQETQAGYAAVYGAYCNKAAEADVGDVSYRGMTCEVEPATEAQGKTYTLKCGATAKGEAAGEQAKEVITQRIGKYNCSLRETESPSQAYRIAYEAYCGGLDEAEKNAGSVPGSLSLGLSLCDVEPWPANEQDKDFELYCR